MRSSDPALEIPVARTPPLASLRERSDNAFGIRCLTAAPNRRSDGGGEAGTSSSELESRLMPLLLRIENVDRLPDGGPLFVEVFGRGLDLGRDQHLDWTLPDPSRYISGKHCEIRYRNGEYILTDVSTNGTYLAGSDQRIQSPYRLRDGDRLVIGHYVVSVSIRDEAKAAEEAHAGAAAAAANPWDVAGEVAAPLPPQGFMPRRTVPGTDPLDRIVDLPRPAPPSAADDWTMPVSAPAAEDWTGPAPTTPLPFAPPPAPTPRRPAAPTASTAAPPVFDDWTVPEPAPPAASGPIPPGPMPPTPIPVPHPGEPEPLPPGPMPPTPIPVPPTPFAGQAPGQGGGPAEPEILARLARAAGIPEEVLEKRDPGELAEEIGNALRIATESLRQLLAARAETKSLVRSSSHTVIRAFDNNPLKFTPSSEEALRIMFGPPTRNYLGAAPAMEQGFSDLKRHQAQTYAAMQAALEQLLADLAPSAVEAAGEGDKGLAGLVGSRKAKHWDTFAERWRGRARRDDERLTDAFMRLFAENYDRLQNEGR